MAGASVEIFKAAAELRAKASISERIADISLRLFICAVAIAAGLIALGGASALFGLGLSGLFHSISISIR